MLDKMMDKNNAGEQKICETQILYNNCTRLISRKSLMLFDQILQKNNSEMQIEGIGVVYSTFHDSLIRITNNDFFLNVNMDNPFDEHQNSGINNQFDHFERLLNLVTVQFQDMKVDNKFGKAKKKQTERRKAQKTSMDYYNQEARKAILKMNIPELNNVIQKHKGCFKSRYYFFLLLGHIVRMKNNELLMQRFQILFEELLKIRVQQIEKKRTKEFVQEIVKEFNFILISVNQFFVNKNVEKAILSTYVRDRDQSHLHALTKKGIQEAFTMYEKEFGVELVRPFNKLS